MSAILYGELPPRLRKAAEMFGATEIGTHDARWVAPLGGCEVTLEPQSTGGQAMRMEARIGSSSSLPSLAADALVMVTDHAATLQRALSAAYMLRDLTIYIADAPCSSCGATGKSMGRACVRCGGTGKRNTVEVP